MKRIIIAVYKQKNSDEALVGVFINDLEGYPEVVVNLSIDKEAEQTIARKINLLLIKEKDFSIDFFEGSKIVSLKRKIIIFVKSVPYFSFDKVLSLLKV